MDTVTILRDLWRLRVFVAGMCVLALLGAAAVALKLPSLESRRYEVGVATAQILVDTPSSQVVNVAPKGADTTAGRADLLATLMVNGGIKTTIAQLAGIQPNQIVGVTSCGHRSVGRPCVCAVGPAALCSQHSGPDQQHRRSAPGYRAFHPGAQSRRRREARQRSDRRPKPIPKLKGSQGADPRR